MNNPPLNDLDMIYYEVRRNGEAIEELRKLIETLLITRDKRLASWQESLRKAADGPTGGALLGKESKNARRLASDSR